MKILFQNYGADVKLEPEKGARQPFSLSQPPQQADSQKTPKKDDTRG
jgi:hypothetical protein